jgi:hypothetical protein
MNCDKWIDCLKVPRTSTPILKYDDAEVEVDKNQQSDQPVHGSQSRMITF